MNIPESMSMEYTSQKQALGASLGDFEDTAEYVKAD